MLENSISAFGLPKVLEMLERKLVDLSHVLAVELQQVQEALAAVLRRDEGEDEPAKDEVGSGQADILRGEWLVLARDVPLRTSKLIVEPCAVTGDWAGALSGLVKRIALVPRLREVRALVGFRRIGDQGAAEVPVDLGAGLPWLPGVEVWGEGIFIEFDEAALKSWERRVIPSFEARLEELEEGIAGWRDPSAASLRFIALHTLSHLIMRRLSFDAGYSSSSLRERIYASDGPSPMAGILIYTADADSEGSLGGLVKMGEPKRLGPVLMGAVQDGSWCSADPVCGETERQGPRGMNGAACHACVLVAETSCTHGNQLLDRRMLLDVGAAPMDAGLVVTR